MNRFTGWIIKLEILLAVLFSVYRPTIPHQPVIHHDQRIASLIQFEERHHFAPDQEKYVKEIIQDADSNSIPAALLVCIELQESSGGKRFNHDSFNPFGWDSGQKNFTSQRAAIDYISNRLGHGVFYRGKTLEGKLRAYNPNPAYSIKIINCINHVQ